MAVAGNGGTTSAHTSNTCDYPPAAPSATAQSNAKSAAAGVTAASAPKLAPQLSQELGGAAATSTTSVDTTRAAAAKTLGFSVAGDQPVVTLQMKGNFTAKKAKIPHGAIVPSMKGSVINVVIEKSTGYVLDWGITNTAANLATLGKTTTS